MQKHLLLDSQVLFFIENNPNIYPVIARVLPVISTTGPHKAPCDQHHTARVARK
jgi:hypothetical protein